MTCFQKRNKQIRSTAVSQLLSIIQICGNLTLRPWFITMGVGWNHLWSCMKMHTPRPRFKEHLVQRVSGAALGGPALKAS